jgi:hypothetical protein
LRRVGIVPTPTFVEPVLGSPLLVLFCDWMRRQRGVSDATLSIYSFELGCFIKKLGEDPSRYDAQNLRQFVLDKSQHSGWASARKCICAIRMFLRFLISQGRCPDYLYASIPTFAHTPGASGERHCSASARRSRLERSRDPSFGKGTPPNRVATDVVFRH